MYNMPYTLFLGVVCTLRRRRKKRTRLTKTSHYARSHKTGVAKGIFQEIIILYMLIILYSICVRGNINSSIADLAISCQ